MLDMFKPYSRQPFAPLVPQAPEPPKSVLACRFDPEKSPLAPLVKGISLRHGDSPPWTEYLIVIDRRPIWVYPGDWIVISTPPNQKQDSPTETITIHYIMTDKDFRATYNPSVAEVSPPEAPTPPKSGKAKDKKA